MKLNRACCLVVQGLLILTLAALNLRFHTNVATTPPSEEGATNTAMNVGIKDSRKPEERLEALLGTTTSVGVHVSKRVAANKEEEEEDFTLDDGLASQYAEVEWVRGVQKRRKLGLEPAEEDPYPHVPDGDLQPFYTVDPPRSRVLGHLQPLELAPPFEHSNKGGKSIAVQRLEGFHYRWPNPSLKEMHFVHVPKCGGTSVTRVLRRMACELHNGTEATNDCCLRPGFCGGPERRLCSVIKGCINHLPLLRDSLAPLQRPSLIMLRGSLSRVVSSWHYRCHNPNFDCYKVRPGLRTWKLHLSGKPTPLGVVNHTFEEFLGMPEFHNIATRMLAFDVEPYGGRKVAKANSKDKKKGGRQWEAHKAAELKGQEFVETHKAKGVHLALADFEKAAKLLDQFAWVGIMELMGTSLLLLSARLGAPLERNDFVTQRATHTALYRNFVQALTPTAPTAASAASAPSATAAAAAPPSLPPLPPITQRQTTTKTTTTQTRRKRRRVLQLLPSKKRQEMTRTPPQNSAATATERVTATTAVATLTANGGAKAAVSAAGTSATGTNVHVLQQRIVAANAYDVALWNKARVRQCSELAQLGLLSHPVVLADLARSQLPPCA